MAYLYLSQIIVGTLLLEAKKSFSHHHFPTSATASLWLLMDFLSVCWFFSILILANWFNNCALVPKLKMRQHRDRARWLNDWQTNGRRAKHRHRHRYISLRYTSRLSMKFNYYRLLSFFIIFSRSHSPWILFNNKKI